MAEVEGAFGAEPSVRGAVVGQGVPGEREILPREAVLEMGEMGGAGLVPCGGGDGGGEFGHGLSRGEGEFGQARAEAVDMGAERIEMRGAGGRGHGNLRAGMR